MGVEVTNITNVQNHAEKLQNTHEEKVPVYWVVILTCCFGGEPPPVVGKPMKILK
jgi:hypothetical protein